MKAFVGVRPLLIVIVSQMEDAKETLRTQPHPSSNNSDFQVDRGVSEGFSAELARDSTW
jgi:hypothetical protein